MGNICCGGANGRPANLQGATQNAPTSSTAPPNPQRTRTAVDLSVPAKPPPDRETTTSPYEEARINVTFSAPAARQSERAQSNAASRHVAVEYLHNARNLLGVVTKGLNALGGTDRTKIDVLRVVENTMGTYERVGARIGNPAESSDELRAIRREFDETPLGQNMRRLHADLATTTHALDQLYEALDADPTNQNLQQALPEAHANHATANQQLHTFLTRDGDTLGYGTATMANNQGVDPDADGLVGLRDLLRDYDDDIINDDQLLQGIAALDQQLAERISLFEGTDPEGVPPVPTVDPFNLARSRASAVDPPGDYREDGSATDEEDSAGSVEDTTLNLGQRPQS